MSAEKTIAIVLRSVEFSESSYISTLFTESAGKITALAKGARRPKSAFENALDLLSISRVVFLRKSSDAMDLLTEAKLERRFRAAARDLTRLYAAYYVIELLNALTGERGVVLLPTSRGHTTAPGVVMTNRSDIAKQFARSLETERLGLGGACARVA